jgi:histidinol-phosphate aminotransferase
MNDSIEKKISQLIRSEIRALKAYHVPDASGLVKLDAMENPYSWPEDMRREWTAVLQDVALNRYPDPDARRLRERLRAALDVPAGMELILGNGSDELFRLFMASPPRAVVLAPTPTLSCMK